MRVFLTVLSGVHVVSYDSLCLCFLSLASWHLPWSPPTLLDSPLSQWACRFWAFPCKPSWDLSDWDRLVAAAAAVVKRSWTRLRWGFLAPPPWYFYFPGSENRLKPNLHHDYIMQVPLAYINLCSCVQWAGVKPHTLQQSMCWTSSWCQPLRWIWRI